MKNKKKKIIVGLVTIIFLFSMHFLFFQEDVYARGVYMKINNEAACTDNQIVTLNTNFNNLQRGCCQFDASEIPNNPNPQWRTIGINSNRYTLSNPSRYGLRTVYMKVRCAVDLRRNSCLPNFSQASVFTLKDSIEYRRSCSDPKMTYLSCSVSNVYEPFNFDTFCNVRVNTTQVANPQNLQIDVEAVPAGGGLALVTRKLDYTNGTVTLPINIPSQGGDPAYQGVVVIAKIVPKPGTQLDDINIYNNSISKRIRLVRNPINSTYPKSECTGPSGARGDKIVPVGKRWVVPNTSTLRLNDCGAASPNEIKCDNNPIPGTGERGVRWVIRPATNSSWKVHWWCEAFSNKRESGTYPYYFRFAVRYEYFEPKAE